MTHGQGASGGAAWAEGGVRSGRGGRDRELASHHSARWQIKAYELFISGIFHLIFSDHGDGGKPQPQKLELQVAGEGTAVCVQATANVLAEIKKRGRLTRTV